MTTPARAPDIIAQLASLRARVEADHAAQREHVRALGVSPARHSVDAAVAVARAKTERHVAAAAHHNGGKVPMATAHAWWIGVERLVNSTDLAPDLSFAEKVRVLRAELGGLGVAAQTDALFVLVARDNSFERAPANVMALVDTELGIAMRQLRAGRAGTLPPAELSSALMRAIALPSSIVDALLA